MGQGVRDVHVTCPEGEAVVIGEMLASPRSVLLTLLLLSECFCVGNGTVVQPITEMKHRVW